MKGYTLRKNGKMMRTRRIAFIIPEETTRLVMERNAFTQAEAEEKLIEAMLDASVHTVGLNMTPDGSVGSFEEAGTTPLDPPIATGF